MDHHFWQGHPPRMPRSDHSVPEASGYDWLLNKCSDLDQANHAAHLDNGEYEAECFHCQTGEGR